MVLKVWCLSDGRAGNAVQAAALATALSRGLADRMAVDRQDRTITLKGWASVLPASALHQSGLALKGVEQCDLSPPYPDLIIGAGRRVAPLAALMQRQHGIPAVQILSPQMTASAFSAVIAPVHDGLVGENVIETMGALSPLTVDEITQAGQAWAHLGDLPGPRLAVLLGGASKSAQFDVVAVSEALTSLAATHTLLITPSRRTPGYLTKSLAALGTPHFVWDGAGGNPYPGLLAHADAILVTADSVNMTSEAASSGKPVHVMDVPGLAPKLARFHESLERHGATRPFAGSIGDWSYAPLAEADRVTDLLIAHLGLAEGRP